MVGLVDVLIGGTIWILTRGLLSTNESATVLGFVSQAPEKSTRGFAQLWVLIAGQEDMTPPILQGTFAWHGKAPSYWLVFARKATLVLQLAFPRKEYLEYFENHFGNLLSDWRSSRDAVVNAQNATNLQTTLCDSKEAIRLGDMCLKQLPGLL